MRKSKSRSRSAGLASPVAFLGFCAYIVTPSWSGIFSVSPPPTGYQEILNCSTRLETDFLPPGHILVSGKRDLPGSCAGCPGDMLQATSSSSFTLSDLAAVFVLPPPGAAPEHRVNLLYECTWNPQTCSLQHHYLVSLCVPGAEAGKAPGEPCSKSLSWQLIKDMETSY